VRAWYAYKQLQRVRKARTLLARTHYLRAFSLALFRHWHAFTRTETRTFRAQWAQACACDRHSKLTRAFRRVHDHAKTLRSMKHFAARLAQRVVEGWKAAVRMLREERRAAEMQARVNEERRRRALEVVAVTDGTLDRVALGAVLGTRLLRRRQLQEQHVLEIGADGAPGVPAREARVQVVPQRRHYLLSPEELKYR
jgi:hypothetical protein